MTEIPPKSPSARPGFSPAPPPLRIVIGGAVLLAAMGMFALARVNYLLFHSLVELFAIVVAAAIFVVGWSARRFDPPPLLLFPAMAFLGIAALDAFHLLAYKGLGVFPGADADLPTQLWIAGRYMEALAFLAGVLLRRGRKIPPGRILVAALAITALLLLAIFTGVFPACFVEGEGLTPFKVVSEYVVSALFLLSGIFLWMRRRRVERKLVFWLLLTFAVKIAAEMSFTLYVDVYGFFNFLGHVLKAAGTVTLYQALVYGCLTTPFSTIFRELSESREDYRRLNAALEGRVQERTAELTRINRELEAFSYSVSHDLRQPLRGLDGFSQALLEDYGDQLDETARDYLQRIRAAAQRMGRLIDDLLRLSRLGRKELEIEEVNLSAAVERIVAALRERDPGRPVTVRIEEGLTVRGDRQLLHLLLENLLENAWKFTGQTPEPRIEFGAGTEGGERLFFVRDNGAGFDMGHAERIFEPFQRLHTEKEFPGTGIGMAIVQRIVRRHGGTLRAEGAVGQGATFRFTLPSSEAPER